MIDSTALEKKIVKYLTFFSLATYTLHIIQNFYQLFHIANVYLVWLAALKLNISVKYDALHFQYLQRKIKRNLS